MIGGAGEIAPVGAPGPAPSADRRGGALPLGIPSGVVSAVVGAGLRAVGVPGIIAGIVTAILGPAVRSATAGTGERAATLSAEDIDALSRSAAETRGPSAAGPLAVPEAVPIPGGDDGLPTALNTEDLDPYGDGQPPALDTPGPAFPGDGWSPF